MKFEVGDTLASGQAVIGAGGLDLANDRAVALATGIVDRDFAAAEDLDAADLLPA